MSLLGGRLRPSNLRERVSSSAVGVGVRKERSSVCNKLSGQHRGFDMNYQGSNPDSAHGWPGDSNLRWRAHQAVVVTQTTLSEQ